MGSQLRRVLWLFLVAVLLAACTDSPPPPLVNTPVPHVNPTPSTDPGQVVVGVNTVAGGYNPHLLADQTTVATALGELTLPSVFRAGPDGSPQLDQVLMVSAEVTKADPYTVTYTIRKDAAWSDGPPVAAEDFAYLSDNMRTQPGVADAAGYRLITGVAGRDGGRTVDVTFAKPYPGWRSLFHDLLPSHVFKDAPGGWSSAMADSFPAAGGPFSVKTLDFERGEIILQRNDRYWGPSTQLQQLILRKASQAELLSAMSTGDDQLAVLRPTKSTYDGFFAQTTVAPLNRIQLSTAPDPDLVELLLRPSGPRMSDPRIRAVVAAAIDREALISLGSGGGPDGQLRADSHVLVPSQPGYAGSIPADGPPAKPDPNLVQQLLTQAGYAKVGGAWLRDGMPLNLVIGAPSDREPYASLAKVLQEQLAAAGIGSKILPVTGDQLFGQSMVAPSATPTSTTPPPVGASTDNTVDIAIAPQPVGGDPATSLASTFGCRTTFSDGTVSAMSPLGFCDRTLQPTIDAALTGALSLADALATIEPALWKQNVAIPLFQLADVVAGRPEITGVGVGPPLVGPFAGAPGWSRTSLH